MYVPTISCSLGFWLLVFTNVPRALTLSYNRPKFCPMTAWYPSASTLADNSSSNINFDAIFVDATDTIYVAAQNLGVLQAWPKGTTSPAENISYSFTSAHSLFATENGDLYIDSGEDGQVSVWSLNASTIITFWTVNDSCYGLFMDNDGSLYCSLMNLHVVMKSPSINSASVVAGNGERNSSAYCLDMPRGIFVDDNFTLYVADSNNQRIQRFYVGDTNGTSVPEDGALGSIILNQPAGVILDIDGYLFILDSGNSRIIGSSKTGFRCLVGCAGSGSAADQLLQPTAFFFDSEGNLIVNDRSNGRIQKFLLATNSCVVSHNQPKLSPCASWHSNATTVANATYVGSGVLGPFGIYVDASNTLYINSRDIGVVRIWTQNSPLPTRQISNTLQLRSLFVSIDGDVYTGSGTDGQVNKAKPSENQTVAFATFNRSCFGLFIDTDQTMYCVMAHIHLAVKQSLTNSSSPMTVIAGNGTIGSAPNMFNNPCGVFVDANFTVYVADTDNHRIQRFYQGEENGTSVAGTGAAGTVVLNRPHAVVVDGDGNLYIVELANHRLVVSRPDGFLCIAGCNKTSGPGPDQFLNPVALALDSYGNVYVTDRNNFRIQKFSLATNTCVETTTVENELTSTAKQELTTSLVVTTTNVQTSTEQQVPSTGQSSTEGNSASSTWTTSYSTSLATSSDTSTAQTTTGSDNSTSTVAHSNTITITTIAPSGIFPAFTPPICLDPTKIGSNCNVSNHHCQALQPCLNNGTCFDNLTLLADYTCSCPARINGSECQFVHQPCQSNTCWNNGTCLETAKYTFNCTCASGWTGYRCQTKLDYCRPLLCQNKGICRSLLGDYQCACLSASYSGRHCEKVSREIQTYEAISRSLGYIAIIAIATTVTIVLLMDALKYGFGIDPARRDLQTYQQETKKKKRRRRTAEFFLRVAFHMPRTVVEVDETVVEPTL